jgi:hypothetical protein
LRAIYHTDQLIKLYLQCLGVPVLCVLDQEHHQKGHDRCAGIDHKLPGVAIAEDRTGNLLDESDKRGNHKRQGPACFACDPVGQTGKPGNRFSVVHNYSLYL